MRSGFAQANVAAFLNGIPVAACRKSRDEFRGGACLRHVAIDLPPYFYVLVAEELFQPAIRAELRDKSLGLEASGFVPGLRVDCCGRESLGAFNALSAGSVERTSGSRIFFACSAGRAA